MAASILHPVHATFRAVAMTVVPEATSPTPDAWLELEGTVQRAIASRPAALQRQLPTFLRLLEWLPVVRVGARFSRPDLERREHVLTKLQNAPPVRLRMGLMGTHRVQVPNAERQDVEVVTRAEALRLERRAVIVRVHARAPAPGGSRIGVDAEGKAVAHYAFTPFPGSG